MLLAFLVNLPGICKDFLPLDNKYINLKSCLLLRCSRLINLPLAYKVSIETLSDTRLIFSSDKYNFTGCDSFQRISRPERNSTIITCFEVVY